MTALSEFMDIKPVEPSQTEPIRIFVYPNGAPACKAANREMFEMIKQRFVFELMYCDRNLNFVYRIII